jgi:hypothetical protein
LLEPWIRDPDGKKSGSGIKNGLKIIKFFVADRIRFLFDPGSGMEIFGSGINI